MAARSVDVEGPQPDVRVVVLRIVGLHDDASRLGRGLATLTRLSAAARVTRAPVPAARLTARAAACLAALRAFAPGARLAARLAAARARATLGRAPATDGKEQHSAPQNPTRKMSLHVSPFNVL